MKRTYTMPVEDIVTELNQIEAERERRRQELRRDIMDEDGEDVEMLRLMVRSAACIIHEYVDSPQFDWNRDKAYIRAAVDAATHLNAIMMQAKEVT